MQIVIILAIVIGAALVGGLIDYFNSWLLGNRIVKANEAQLIACFAVFDHKISASLDAFREQQNTQNKYMNDKIAAANAKLDAVVAAQADEGNKIQQLINLAQTPNPDDGDLDSLNTRLDGVLGTSQAQTQSIVRVLPPPTDTPPATGTGDGSAAAAAAKN